MIPKVIHYCWYGRNPLPELALICIESWKKNSPDYEIIRWDETNSNLYENDYIREAYESKKWAFVTDYIRLKVLFEYGGIYMDTDVEVLRSLNPFLSEAAFSGFENTTQIQTGIIAAEKGHPFLYELMSYYKSRHFIKPDRTFDQKTNVITITEIFLEHGLIANNQKQTVCGFTLYPNDVFCPKNCDTGEITITKDTVCIHHFAGSWYTYEEKKLKEISQKLKRKFGRIGGIIFKFYKYGVHPTNIIFRLKYGKKFWD